MEYDKSFWIKFFALVVPLSVIMWIWAPSLKWKLLFTPCVALGVWLALSGRSIKGITPIARKGY